MYSLSVCFLPSVNETRIRQLACDGPGAVARRKIAHLNSQSSRFRKPASVLMPRGWMLSHLAITFKCKFPFGKRRIWHVGNGGAVGKKSRKAHEWRQSIVRGRGTGRDTESQRIFAWVLLRFLFQLIGSNRTYVAPAGRESKFPRTRVATWRSLLHTFGAQLRKIRC